MTFEQLLALLTAKFTGMRKDGLEQLAKSIMLNATNLEEAQALVEKYTTEQVTGFITDWRKDVDKEVGNGVKTAESNFKKKYNITEDPKPETPPTPPADPANPPTDITAIVTAAVQAAVKPLQEELNTFKSGNVESTRKDALNSKLANAPDDFKSRVIRDYGRMKFESDEQFTEFLTDTEKDLTDHTQSVSNQNLSAFGRPVVGAGENSKEVPAGVTDYIGEKSGEKGAASLGGKEI